MREQRRGDKSEASNFKEDLPILTGWAGVPYSELWHPYIIDRDPIMDLTLASKIHRGTRCNGGPSPVPRPKVLPEGRPILHSPNYTLTINNNYRTDHYCSRFSYYYKNQSSTM